jgi:hypothetical protein
MQGKAMRNTTTRVLNNDLPEFKREVTTSFPGEHRVE